MPIPIECDCGKSLKLADRLAGKKIRCPECSSVLKVPEMPEMVETAADEDDDERMKARLRPKPKGVATSIQKKPKKSAPPTADDEEDTTAYQFNQENDEEEKPKKRKKPRKREDSSRYHTPSQESKQYTNMHAASTGMFMMIGAVIWFVLGLFAGYIYFYPPVLFVLGLIAFIKGLLGRS